MIQEKTEVLRGKRVPVLLYPPQILTCTGVGMNLVLHSDGPSIVCLNHDTVPDFIAWMIFIAVCW
jgi:hypothetical protein